MKSKSLLFSGLFLILVSALLGQIFSKYNAFLFRTPVYYCDHLSCSTIIKIASTIGTTLFKVLLVTTLVTFGKTIIDLYRIKALRRNLTSLKMINLGLCKIIQDLKLKDKVIVVKHNEPFAFCLGLLRPKIVVADSLVRLLSPNELKAVLCHEKYHLDHFDALTAYVAHLIQSLFPFFPLLKDQAKYLTLDREIKADRWATQRMGNSKEIVSSLKKLLSYPLVPAYSTFPAFIDNNDFLEIRIKELLKKKVTFHAFSIRNAALSLGALILLFGLIYLPLNTVNIDAAGNREVVACLDNESCRQACLQEQHNNDLLFNQLHQH